MPPETVSTQDAPKPRGHYAQATVHQGVIYVATQLPIPPDAQNPNPSPNSPGSRPSDGPPAMGSIEKQARLVLNNVLAIVRAGGGSADSLLRITIYVSDVAHWPAVNRVYESVLGDCCPARGVIPTGKLHLGADVAADAIAAVE